MSSTDRRPQGAAVDRRAGSEQRSRSARRNDPPRHSAGQTAARHPTTVRESTDTIRGAIGR